MSKSGGKASSFLVGAAIGSVIALMLAPFSGKKMRRLTVQKSKKLIDDAKTKYNSIEEDASEKISDVKAKGMKVWDKTKEGTNEVKDTVKSKVGEIKDVLSKPEAKSDTVDKPVAGK